MAAEAHAMPWENALPFVFARMDLPSRYRAALVSRAWSRAAQSDIAFSGLNFNSCKRTDEVVDSLIKNDKLRLCTNLSFEFAQKVDDSLLLKAAEQVGNLQVLNLNACQNLTKTSLVPVLERFAQSLESVSLYWIPRLLDEDLMSLKKLSKIRKLCLAGCKHLTAESLVQIANLRTLEYLDLTRCVGATDSVLKTLSPALANLKTLLLYACCSYADAGVNAVLKNCRHLNKLDICGANSMTGKAFEGLPQNLQLRWINLGWCIEVDDAGIESLCQACNNGLVALFLLGNAKVTDRSLNALKETSANTLRAIDLSGCLHMKGNSSENIKSVFPNISLIANLGTAPNYEL